MPDPLSPDFSHIEALIENEDFDAARTLLAQQASADPRLELLRIKLGLSDGSLAAELAVHKLTQLMRQDPELEGARELYQRAAREAYAQHRSSMAHSHPPLPGKPQSK